MSETRAKVRSEDEIIRFSVNDFMYCTVHHMITYDAHESYVYDNNKKVRLQNESSKDDHDYDDDEVVKGCMIYVRT